MLFPSPTEGGKTEDSLRRTHPNPLPAPRISPRSWLPPDARIAPIHSHPWVPEKPTHSGSTGDHRVPLRFGSPTAFRTPQLPIPIRCIPWVEGLHRIRFGDIFFSSFGGKSGSILVSPRASLTPSGPFCWEGLRSLFHVLLPVALFELLLDRVLSLLWGSNPGGASPSSSEAFGFPVSTGAGSSAAAFSSPVFAGSGAGGAAGGCSDPVDSVTAFTTGSATSCSDCPVSLDGGDGIGLAAPSSVADDRASGVGSEVAVSFLSFPEHPPTSTTTMPAMPSQLIQRTHFTNHLLAPVIGAVSIGVCQ